MPVLPAGTEAPEFTLRRADGRRFTRADLEGRTTVLVFYPFAFTAVCNDQLSVYNDLLGEFAERGATLYAVSCDAAPSQEAFRSHLGIEIAQLSDFEPKGATCAAFGVLHPGGFARRAIVIVGPDRVIRYGYEADSIDELPGANLIFDGLDAVPA